MHTTELAEHEAVRSRVSEILASGATLSIACVLCFPALIEGPRDTTAPLVHRTDLVYVGAFRTPDAYQWGGGALTYWPAHNSLMMETSSAFVGEFTIPSPGTATAVAGLPVAVTVQAPTDILGGHRLDAGDTNASLGLGIGGLLINGSSLVVSVYEGYDASQAMSRSHFITGLDFSHLPAVAGPYQVGTAGLGTSPTVKDGGSPAGWVGEYATPIPPAWQSVLGGTALAGECCLSIIGRTSQGPSLSVFNPSDLGHTVPAPATILVGYPSAHPSLGRWDGRGTDLYTMATEVDGVVWVQGTDSVLILGTKGTAGNACYGVATTDAVNSWPNKVVPVPNGGANQYCYDPAHASSHGEFAYPYNYFVWAYDANDLAAVKTGSKQAWEVMPYATWTFELPFEDSGRRLAGASFDPAAHRLFVAQRMADGSAPVIHLFRISAAATTTGGR